jgi:hypothetical protein
MSAEAAAKAAMTQLELHEMRTQLELFLGFDEKPFVAHATQFGSAGAGVIGGDAYPALRKCAQIGLDALDEIARMQAAGETTIQSPKG